MDTDFHKIIIGGNIVNSPKPINIGSHVWIGMNVIILKGSKIPDDCVIAAGSIITKELGTPHAVFVNNSLIRSGIDWEE